MFIILAYTLLLIPTSIMDLSLSFVKWSCSVYSSHNQGSLPTQFLLFLIKLQSTKF